MATKTPKIVMGVSILLLIVLFFLYDTEKNMDFLVVINFGIIIVSALWYLIEKYDTGDRTIRR